MSVRLPPPPRRIVGVLLNSESTEIADDTIYDLDIIKERVERGEQSDVSRNNDVMGYISGLGNLQGMVEAAGQEIVTPFFSPPHISLSVSAVGLEGPHNQVKKYGVLHPGQDDHREPIPLYVVDGPFPKCLSTTPKSRFMWHLNNPALLTDKADFSIWFAPPFVTSLAISATIIPRSRFVEKRARSPESDIFGGRKYSRTEAAALPGPSNIPAGWLGPPTTFQIDHATDLPTSFDLPASIYNYHEQAPVHSTTYLEPLHSSHHGLAESSRLQGEGIGYEWRGGSGGFQNEGMAHEQEEYISGGSGEVQIGTGWGDQSAEGDQYLPREDGGTEWGKHAIEPNQSLAGGSGGHRSGAGWEGGHVEGDQRRVEGSGGLQGGTGWEGSHHLAGEGGRAGWGSGSTEANPGGSGELQGGTGWGYLSAEGGQGLTGGSGGLQGGPGWKDLSSEGAQGPAQWLVGDYAANNEAPHFGRPEEDSDAESDAKSSSGDLEVDEEATTPGPPVGPREPPIAIRDNSDYGPARIACYIALIYRRRLIERKGKLSTLFCSLAKAKLLVEDSLSPMAYDELRISPDTFSEDTKLKIRDDAARAILRRIGLLKEYASDIVYGPIGRGGYGITDTPEGALEAKALLEGDRFLYDPESGVKYARTCVRQLSHRITHGKVGGDQHPYGYNDEDVPEFFSRPELRDQRSDTADRLACDLLFERLNLAAGQAGIAKSRPDSRWDAREVDYKRHLHLMPSEQEWVKKMEVKTMCVRRRGRTTEGGKAPRAKARGGQAQAGRRKALKGKGKERAT